MAAAAGDPAEALRGLWGAERIFGTALQGELRLVREDRVWDAQIGGVSATAAVEGAALRLTFPGGAGELRARLDDAQRIVGHWLQPRTVSANVRYATPVALSPDGDDVWRGDIRPFDDRLSMYLMLQPGEGDLTGGFLRNPERNLGMFYRVGRVVRRGELVSFYGAQSDEPVLVGHHREQRDVLSIYFPFYGATFDFTRRGREEAIGFYPRTPAQPYRYRTPASVGDGWPTGRLAEAQMQLAPLHALVDRVLGTELTSVTAPYLQAVLVARHGRLVFEEYFYGFRRDRLHDTRSAGKSIASTLAGSVLDAVSQLTLDSPAFTEHAAGYAEVGRADARKREISIAHLLSMRSGLECDDNDSDSPGNEDRMYEQSEQPDWYAYAAALPMAAAAGERAVYCTAGVNLIGAVLRRATGQSVIDLFQERFAGPLGIERYHLNLMPSGDAYLGGGVYLRPRDLLKLGQLYLDKGVWQGRRIVSAQWIEAATSAQASLYDEGDYGYGWWRKDYRVGEHVMPAFYASGNGGQLVIVIPALDLVVAFAGGNYGNFPTWRRFRDELVPAYVIPAALEPVAASAGAGQR